MIDKKMDGITTQSTLHIKNIPGSKRTVGWICNRNCLIKDWRKSIFPIKKSNINTTFIGRFFMHIFISQFSKRCIIKQEIENLTVLNFGKANNRRKSTFTGSHYYLRNMCQLIEKTTVVPVSDPLGQKLLIACCRIVLGIEKIFNIIKHDLFSSEDIILTKPSKRNHSEETDDCYSFENQIIHILFFIFFENSVRKRMVKNAFIMINSNPKLKLLN